MLNHVILIGRLCFDPELRYTNSGTAVASIRLAVDGMGPWNGESNDTGFIDVTVWGKQAESSAEYLEKGRLIAVDGRLQIDEWEDEDENTRRTAKVVAESVRFLDYPKEQGDQAEDKPQGKGQGSKGRGQQGQQGKGQGQGSKGKSQGSSNRGQKGQRNR